MSDQADRLRQLVGARRVAATFADSTEVERGTTAVDSKSASLRHESISALHKRQRGRRDFESGSEPGDRAGGNRTSASWWLMPTSDWQTSISCAD